MYNEKKRQDILILILIIFAIFSLQYINENFSDIWNTITGKATTGTSVANVTVASVTPVIESIRPPATQTITEDSFINVTFFFNATDADGSGDLDNSTASGLINKSGETSRSNFSCSNENLNSTTNRYNCTVALWYFDGDGDWTINVSIKDNSGNYVSDSSRVFTVNPTTAMKMDTTGLRWTNVNLGDANTLADDNVTINNTGNVNIPQGNVSITAYNLHGLTTASQFIYAANFSVNVNNACEGNALSNNTLVNVTSSVLSKGNNSINNATSGQEQLAFCLENIDNAGLSVQTYETVSGFPWEVKVA